jgi:hypothetical protein
MALTLTKAVSSQHMLKYAYAATAGSLAITLTAAQLIADCSAGPLKDLLQRANGGITTVTWANLLNSKALSIYLLPHGTSGGVFGDTVALVNFQAAPNVLAVNTNAAAGVDGMIEIRYYPSQVR